MYCVLHGRGARCPGPGIDKLLILSSVYNLFLRGELGSLEHHLAKTLLQHGQALSQRFLALKDDARDDRDRHSRGAAERETGRDRSAYRPVA